jgi:hypothetical protein
MRSTSAITTVACLAAGGHCPARDRGVVAAERGDRHEASQRWARLSWCSGGQLTVERVLPNGSDLETLRLVFFETD